MHNVIAGEGLRVLESAITKIPVCNHWLLLSNLGFALIALTLAGICGFYLGKNGSTPYVQKQETAVVDVQAGTVNVREELQSTVVHTLQRQGGSNDPTKPGAGLAPSIEASTVATAQVAPTPNQNEVLAAMVKNDSEKWKMQYVPEDLKPAYAKYVSQWVDSDLSWGGPASVHASELGSRMQSLRSGISGAYTVMSEDDWRSTTGREGAFNPAMHADWRISPNQLQFSFDMNGELVKLDNRIRPHTSLTSRPAETYKAVLDGRIEVAVKVIKIMKDDLPEGVVRKLALQLLTMNSCPHIVHFWGICQTDETVMIITELVEGRSARDTTKQNSIGMQWYRNGKLVARSVAQGLAELHAHQIEHKGLRSRRVLVRARDNATKLCGVNDDLIMRHIKTARDMRLASSFEWTAPEVLVGRRHGSAADMFAFGVLLWEIVTQELPIRGTLRDVRVPEECPQAIAFLMTDCRAKDPAQRPTAAQALEIIQRNWNLKQDGSGNSDAIFLASEPNAFSSFGGTSRPPLSANRSPEQFRPCRPHSAGPPKTKSPTPRYEAASSSLADKALRAAALRSLQSAPVKNKDSRDRIEAGLRDGFEKVYAQNRSKTLLTALSAKARYGPPARYMSRSPSPEPIEPNSSQQQSDSRQPASAQKTADPARDSSAAFLGMPARRESGGSQYHHRRSTSTEASFAPDVPDCLDYSPDTPSLNTPGPSLSKSTASNNSGEGDADKEGMPGQGEIHAKGLASSSRHPSSDPSIKSLSLGNSEASFREMITNPFYKPEKAAHLE